jgi:hypothetical protein
MDGENIKNIKNLNNMVNNNNLENIHSIAKIFSPRNMNYTIIPNNYNLELLVKKLVLFDLNYPIIIDINNNLPLFLILVKKFNKRGNCMLKHISLTDKYEVDGIFQIMKDFVYINYNPVHVCEGVGIRKENVKFFYFKNLMICFNFFPNERVNKSENYHESLVSKVLINHMKLNFLKNPEKFFEKGKKKIFPILENRISLDDTIYDELDQEGEDGKEKNEKYFQNENSNFNFNEEISNSLNLILQSDSKLHSNSLNLYKNEEEMLNFLKSSKNSKIFPKFNFLNFYLNLFSHSIKTLLTYGDKLIAEGENLKNLYLIIDKKQKSKFLKSVLLHQEKIECLLEEIKIKYSFLQNLSFDEQRQRSYKSVLKMSFIEESKFTPRDCNSYKEKFNFLIKSFLGKLKDMEMNMMKQINIAEMMIKTLKIIQDDDKYIRDRKLNILFVILTIIQFLFLPGIFLQAWFSVNIKIPMGDVENLLPFFFLILIMFSMPIGQLYVFYRYKHLIL